MKKTIAVFFALCIVSVGVIHAQQKIGHVNSLTILQSMPEFKQMSDDIDKQKQSYSKALEGMYGDYDKKQKELQQLSNDKSTPDPILESHIQELQDLQKRIQDFESKANEDLQKFQQDKLKPINDKYLKVVKEVASTSGYSYILDVASGAVAYYPEASDDITDLVLKKLGITAAPAPQTPPSNKPANSPKLGGK